MLIAPTWWEDLRLRQLMLRVSRMTERGKQRERLWTSKKTTRAFHGDAEAEFLDAKEVLKKGKAEAKDIFCVAKPLDHYGKVFNTILGLTNLSAGKIVVITRTAHPGLPVAARLLGLEVLTCVEECPPHSKGHGEELMLKFWKELKWKEAEALTASKEVRHVGNSELTFLTVLGPEKAVQVVQACFPPPEMFCVSRYTNICQIIYEI